MEATREDLLMLMMYPSEDAPSGEFKEWFVEDRHKYVLSICSDKDEKSPMMSPLVTYTMSQPQRFPPVVDSHSSDTHGIHARLRDKSVPEWRLKSRMRTNCVALICCLNIGVDPPDVVKPSPCARLEAWLDPLALHQPKAMDMIGTALQRQYEQWQHRARYKQALDPTDDDVKKVCQSLRRAASRERVLLHYNGHGVPRPSQNGEIWVFNEEYTQYLPVSVYDLQTWVGTPSIYVFDCSSAGRVVDAFYLLDAQRRSEFERKAELMPEMKDSSNVYRSFLDETIILAACGADEVLPVNPELPADLFTSCLTTPIKVALRWCASNSTLSTLTPEDIDEIPGLLNERKTPLGELHWIFTAVTDTIAWNVLPHDLFQKLFRQDSLVSSLFRSFLIADRIMRSVNCHPISHPVLPDTHKHPMWRAWDLAAEFFLSQLEQHLKDKSGKKKNRFFKSSFFSDQLTAFDVWLEFGAVDRSPPMQLPIVLQVLLSQAHRLRALVLLARFLDKGPWAVDLALSVGFFFYVLRLLESPAIELREVLVFILTKIVVYDPSTKVELVKGNSQQYFVNHLASPSMPPKKKVMSCFVLATICRHYRLGQRAVLTSGGLSIFLSCVKSEDSMLRRWGCLCLGALWENFDEAKWIAVDEGICEAVCGALRDPIPEVRAAAAFSIGTFIRASCTDDNANPVDKSKYARRISLELLLGCDVAKLIVDGSPLVRREVVIALSQLAYAQRDDFLETAVSTESKALNARKDSIAGSPIMSSLHSPTDSPNASPSFAPLGSPDPQTPVTRLRVSLQHMGRGGGEIIMEPDIDHASRSPHGAVNKQRSMLWKIILAACRDPHPSVSDVASAVKRYMLSVKFDKIHIPKGGVHRKISAPDIGSQVNEMTADGTKPVPLKKVQSMSTIPVESEGSKSNARTPSAKPKRTPSSQQQRNHSSAADSRKGPYKQSSRGSNNQSSRSSSRVKDKQKEIDSKVQFKHISEIDSLWAAPPSTYLEFSSLYFSSVLMDSGKSNDSVESVLTRDWRLRRNLDMKKRAESVVHADEVSIPSQSKKSYVFDQVAVFHSSFDRVSTVLLHPFENILIACDFRDNIGVWDHKELERVNRFRNENPKGTKISHASFVNDMHTSLLMTGSDDGVVRLWKNTHIKDKQKLVSAWAAVRDLTRSQRSRGRSATSTPGPHRRTMSPLSLKANTPSTPSSAAANANSSSNSLGGSGGSALVLDWHQEKGHVVAAGATSRIRVWDVNAEQCVLDFSSCSDSSVSSICSGQNPNMLYAGYGDGAVRLFDCRLATPLVDTLNHHSVRVVKVALQRQGTIGGRLVSADLKGDVVICDARMNQKSLHSIQAHQSRPLNAMAVHNYAPILATGSYKQFIKVLDMNGQTLNVIKYHEGFLGQRVGPISSVCFHPHKLILAAGALDAFLSIHVAPRF